ncbi:MULTISPECIES: CbiX/SirB N-terminal domain-containing protein [unclassified Leptolyngbya]|uniref:sirohydrochlorin chelatase n=1 Tax=unclassified Leptolyngbya TaxID=2650499 RepID=UPI00168585A0|nr:MULTISPECIES: CbiX/SirB N-terminal domain-containing protein [unclassified Leptolyngbya]MBD1912537.1 sirohydrochlorin chelatase [Leptolyngbya sp. FACHB-8]MBD2156452.1 sirohydrochlorin chelatase [Leptolyngbya sp. FACHB-16]
MPTSAYLLVAHGSRDPRPQLALETLGQRVQQALAQTTPALATTPSSTTTQPATTIPLVETACLELQPQPLHQQIQNFAEQAIVAHISTLEIVPLFLLPGVHVMDDIPAEVAIAQQALGQGVQLHIRPYLGANPQLFESLRSVLPRPRPGGMIIMSHGSRRPGGNDPIESLAQRLGAIAAYWSVSPTLEEQVTAQIRQGCQEIIVFPYILFPAGITDAIATTLNELSQRYPYVRFQALPALSEIAPLEQWVLTNVLNLH